MAIASPKIVNIFSVAHFIASFLGPCVQMMYPHEKGNILTFFQEKSGCR